MRKLLFILVPLVILIVLVFSLQKPPEAPKSPTFLSASKGSINLIIASTTEDRARGLSYRASLAENEGMFFIFPAPGHYGFWMKDMNFPIDIVWIDENKKVVGIVPGARPDSYPQTFLPPQNIKYVLEINAGYAEKWGIATGTAL